MPLFGSGSTPFDNDVEKITNERNTSEDWGLIMDLCDRVAHSRDGPKDCLKSISKRLHHQDPHVVMQAITLLDACVNNCGKPFKLEVASRDFESDYKKLLSSSRLHPKVRDKLLATLKKWAEQDFKGDPQLNLIPSLYQQLRREGEDFSGAEQTLAPLNASTLGDLTIGHEYDPPLSSDQHQTAGGKKPVTAQAAGKVKGAYKATKSTLGSMVGGGGGGGHKKKKERPLPNYRNPARNPNLHTNGYGDPAGFDHPNGAGAMMADEPRRQQLPKDPNVVASQQEEDDIAKAIQLSLQESKGKAPAASSRGTNGGSSVQANSAASGLYASLTQAMSGPAAGANGKDAANTPEPKKARALYDFEAAEDNELTFMAGEIVLILDDSDANWWKGSNHRGEGLFPSNFVTKDLEDGPPKEEKEKRRRSVQFNEEVEVKTLDQNSPEKQQQPQDPAKAQQPLGPLEIDEAKIDQVLSLLNDSDPTTEDADDPTLVPLEQHVNAMGPLIDTELEGVDRRLAQLTRLSTELVDALNLYHQLMKELPAPAAAAAPMGYGAYGAVPQQQQYAAAPPQMYYGQQQQQQPPAAVPTTTATAAAPPAGADPNSSYMWQQQPQAAVAPGQLDSSTVQPQPPPMSYPAMPAPMGAPAPGTMPPQQQQQQQQMPQQAMAPPGQSDAYGYAPAPPATGAPVGMPPQQAPPQQALYTTEG